MWLCNCKDCGQMKIQHTCVVCTFEKWDTNFCPRAIAMVGWLWQNQSKWSTPLWPLYPHHSLLTCFLNSDRTVWSDQKTLESFTSAVHLRWRTVPCEKSMEPSGPRSDHPVLWIVTGSHGSGGCLVSSLKRHHSTFFFPLYSVVWSILNKFNPHPSNETLASLSEI